MEVGRLDRRLRWTFRLFAGSCAGLGLVVAARILIDPSPADGLILLLAVLVGAAAAIERRAIGALEAGRRAEAESFARILRGLSRSVSPDAIVAAIVEELGTGTGADHVVIVRRRPELRILEATLHTTRPGIPTSSTALSLADLDDPAEDDSLAAAAIAAARGRRMTAIPIGPEVEAALLPARALVASGVGQLTAPVAIAPLGEGFTRAPIRLAVSSGPARSDAARPPAGAVRSSQAISVRAGADRRIADRISQRVRDIYGLKHTITAPLRVSGHVEGAIVLSRRTAGGWSPAAVRILDASATEASAALARVYSHRQAETRATTDALTGLPNRRYFDEYVGLLARRRRADDRLGLLMVDIDRFKRLNDTFGHAVGDHVLRAVAGAIAKAVREGDVPARFGGEEFAVLLRNPSPEIAFEVGERVRRAVGELDLRRLGVPAVSVSVGVAVSSRPDDAIDGLVVEADRALYRAKRGGRDRVVAA